MRKHPFLALLALLPHFPLEAEAQDLRTYDTFRYGVTGPNVDVLAGKNGGPRWGGPWEGLNQSRSDLIAYWDLEQNANDFSGSGLHGTQMGGTFSNDVPANTALWSSSSYDLPGSTLDYIDLSAHVAHFQELGTGTISAWFRIPHSLGGAFTILAASDSRDPSSELRLIYEQGSLIYDVRGDGSCEYGMASTTQVNDDQWHHACVTVDPTGLATLYLDGFVELVQEEPFFNRVHDLDTMAIGRNVDSGGPQWPWYGKIDDVAVWGRVLTPAEVSSLANGTQWPINILGAPVPSGPKLLAASLSTPAFSSYDLQPSGNRISESDGIDSTRPLPAPIDLRLDEIWYVSALVRREDLVPGILDPFQLEFRHGPNVRASFGWDISGTFGAGPRDIVIGTEPALDQTTYFFVGKIVASSTSGMDQTLLKVYGPSDLVATSDAAFAGSGPGATQWTAQSPLFHSNAVFDYIELNLKGTNSRIEIDEIRIGRTWESVTRAAYGSGCLGARITQNEVPTMGSQTYSLGLRGGPMLQAALLNFGISRESWQGIPLPLDLSLLGASPGCSLLASIDNVSVTTVTNLSGDANLGLPIPSDPSLLLGAVFAQWFVTDPAAGLLPMRFSDAVEILVQR